MPTWQMAPHEAIWRFNSAPSWPEQHVGNRTTVAVVAGNAAHPTVQRSRKQPRHGAVIIAVYCLEFFSLRCQRFVQHSNLLQINPALVSDVLEATPRYAPQPSHAPFLIPSTGLIGVALAQLLCTRVTLYGFADPTAAGPGACAHYWNCRTGNETAYLRNRKTYHDWVGQWYLLQRWHAESRFVWGDR